MSIQPDFDIFSLGRAAQAKARTLFDGRACLTSTRRLNVDGTWFGPPRATCSLADEDAISARGGLASVREAGANAILCNLESTVALQAVAAGLRCLVRVPFAAGEAADERRGRVAELADFLGHFPGVDGIVPVPLGEVQGLDTLAFFALCRQEAEKKHVIADFERFGHKLGQLCLSFGADEILGSIVGQRALRLGERASSNEITRDEAVLLVRAAGFVPCERLPDGGISEL